MSRLHPAVGAASAVASMTGLAALYRAGFGSRSQTFGPFPFRGETDEPVVALTFDDGPNEPWTSRARCLPPSSRPVAAPNAIPTSAAGWWTRATCSPTTASATPSAAT